MVATCESDDLSSSQKIEKITELKDKSRLFILIRAALDFKFRFKLIIY